MITKENKVELISYFGGDSTHASPVHDYIDENEPDTNRRNRLLKILIENNELECFRNSFLQFKLITDYTTFINFNKKLEGYNIVPEIYSHKYPSEYDFYIPMDLGEFPSKADIKLGDEEKTIFEGGTNWWNILYDYNELGLRIHKQMLKDLDMKLPSPRIRDLSKFTQTLGAQVIYTINFSWLTFYNFYIEAMKPTTQLEFHDIAEDMMSLVEEIPYKPFKNTIKYFNINETK